MKSDRKAIPWLAIGSLIPVAIFIAYPSRTMAAICAVAALIIGHISLEKIKIGGGKARGRWIAIAGVSSGCLLLALLALGLMNTYLSRR